MMSGRAELVTTFGNIKGVVSVHGPWVTVKSKKDEVTTRVTYPTHRVLEIRWSNG